MEVTLKSVQRLDAIGGHEPKFSRLNFSTSRSNLASLVFISLSFLMGVPIYETYREFSTTLKYCFKDIAF